MSAAARLPFAEPVWKETAQYGVDAANMCYTAAC